MLHSLLFILSHPPPNLQWKTPKDFYLLLLSVPDILKIDIQKNYGGDYENETI